MKIVPKRFVLLAFLLVSISLPGSKCQNPPGKCNTGLPQPPVTTDRAWQEQALREINKQRAEHDTPPLEIDEELTRISQNWANHLMTTVHKLEHTMPTNRGMRCGENLMVFEASSMEQVNDGTYAIKSFYNEYDVYDYATEKKMANAPSDKVVGHFTQSIWKASKYVGFAMAREHNPATKLDKVYVVATFFPPGNIGGEYKANVLPRKDGRQPSGTVLPVVKAPEGPGLPPPATRSGGAAPVVPAAPPSGGAPAVPTAPASNSGQQGRALPPCSLPRPYKGKWKPTGRKRVCNRAINNRMEKAQQANQNG